MEHHTQSQEHSGWLEASGLLHILRTLGFAVHPTKLGLAVAGIILSCLLGVALDWVWTLQGGVGDRAVVQYAQARVTGDTYEEPTGDRGVFSLWREYEVTQVNGLLASFVPGLGISAPRSLAARASLIAGPGPLAFVMGACHGVAWMFRHHTFYAILFWAGCLIIWSLAGGAICRVAALQFTRDERPTMGHALDYARQNLFRGFVLAPCIPLAFIALTIVLMWIGGLLLAVPVLGDVVAGVAFILALVGGFVIALLLVGFVAGGSLLWPAVAVEGQDAYDSFSRAMSYTFTRPWKTVLYGIIAAVFGGVCWFLVQHFTSFMLGVTRSIVGFGTSPFGWWSRGAEGAGVSKLDMLWPFGGAAGLHAWPDWSQLSWYEYISAALIGVYVLLVIALMWSFLASFYYSGSTIIYCLLRRDVDKTDLGDVHVEDFLPPESAQAATSTSESTPSSSSLPIVEDTPARETPAQDTPAPAPAQEVVDDTTDGGDDAPGGDDNEDQRDGDDQPDEKQGPSKVTASDEPDAEATSNRASEDSGDDEKVDSDRPPGADS